MVSPEFAYLENWARSLCEKRVLEGRDYRIIDPVTDEPSPSDTRILLHHDPFEPRENLHSGQTELKRFPNRTAISFDPQTGTITFELNIFPHAREVFELWEYFYGEIHGYFDQHGVDLRVIGSLEDNLSEHGVALDQTEANRSLTFYQSRTHTRGTLGERDFGLTLGWQGTLADVASVFQQIPQEYIAGETEEERWHNFLTYFFTSVVDGVERVYPFVYQYEKYFFEWRSAEIVYEKMRAQTDDERMHEPLDMIMLGYDMEDSRYYRDMTRERLLASSNWFIQLALVLQDEGKLERVRFADRIFYEPEYSDLLRAKLIVQRLHESVSSPGRSASERCTLWYDVTQEALWIEIHPFCKERYILDNWDDFLERWQVFVEGQGLESAFEIVEGHPGSGNLGFFQSELLRSLDDETRGVSPSVVFGIAIQVHEQLKSELGRRGLTVADYARSAIVKLSQHYEWVKAFLLWYEDENRE